MTYIIDVILNYKKFMMLINFILHFTKMKDLIDLDTLIIQLYGYLATLILYLRRVGGDSTNARSARDGCMSF